MRRATFNLIKFDEIDVTRQIGLARLTLPKSRQKHGSYVRRRACHVPYQMHKCRIRFS